VAAASLNGGISSGPANSSSRGDGTRVVDLPRRKAMISNIRSAGVPEASTSGSLTSRRIAYRFSGGLKVFTGCEPRELQSRPCYTTRRARAAPAAGGSISAPPDSSRVACVSRAPGEATSPKMTVTGPEGRAYTTANPLGDYVFISPSTTSPAPARPDAERSSSIRIRSTK